MEMLLMMGSGLSTMLWVLEYLCQLEQMFMKLESESRFKYVFRRSRDCLIFGVVKNFIVVWAQFPELLRGIYSRLHLGITQLQL